MSVSPGSTSATAVPPAPMNTQGHTRTVYTGYTKRCVRSARQPDAMVTQDKQKVHVKNQGLLPKLSPSLKNRDVLQGPNG